MAVGISESDPAYLNAVKVRNDIKEFIKNIQSGSKDYRPPEYFPAIIYLNSPDGFDKVASAIAENQVGGIDFGATTGTAFGLYTRIEAAIRRKETQPYDPVSLVTKFENTLASIDYDKLHPSISEFVKERGLEQLNNLAFVRYPATEQAQNLVGSYYLSDRGEMQTFSVPQDHALMAALENHNLKFLAVRSGNIHKRPEACTPERSLLFALMVKADFLAFRNPESIIKASARTRLGSQPIIVLPQVNEDPTIWIARQANTHKDIIEYILRESGLPSSVNVNLREEKPYHDREPFRFDLSAHPTINQLKNEILRASGLS